MIEHVQAGYIDVQSISAWQELEVLLYALYHPRQVQIKAMALSKPLQESLADLNLGPFAQSKVPTIGTTKAAASAGGQRHRTVL